MKNSLLLGMTLLAACGAFTLVPEKPSALSAALKEGKVPEQCIVVFDAEGWYCLNEEPHLKAHPKRHPKLHDSTHRQCFDSEGSFDDDDDDDSFEAAVDCL